MSSNIPIKIGIGDLTELEIANPTASRSAIVRAILVAVVAKGVPLTAGGFTPPAAATWTTVAFDMGSELLVTRAFQINNVKNLSALLFNAVRDPFIFPYANEFLSLSAAARKRRVDDVLLTATGKRLPDGSALQDEHDEREQRTFLMRFLIDELQRTADALEEANARHAAANDAFLAFKALLGEMPPRVPFAKVEAEVSAPEES